VQLVVQTEFVFVGELTVLRVGRVVAIALPQFGGVARVSGQRGSEQAFDLGS
jgi:hypothetical protein